MGTDFGEYKKSLEVDLSDLTFKESHYVDGVYYLDKDPDIETTTKTIKNEAVKKIVKNLDKHN